MFKALIRALRPLDTTEVDAAIAEADEAVKAVGNGAVGLRRDVSTLATGALAATVIASASHLLHKV